MDLRQVDGNPPQLVMENVSTIPPDVDTIYPESTNSSEKLETESSASTAITIDVHDCL